MNRYPGIRPFRTDEQNLFFGRDTDIERLHRLLDLEQMVILYGKSGYGKDSLLSAGIYPKLDAESRYRHWEIRFGPWKDAASTAPALNMTNALRSAASTHPLNRTFPGEHSLWLAIKRLQIPAEPSTVHPPLSKLWRASRPPSTSNRFILFFDQFEELFTYPPEQILEFKKQLAEALYSRVPKRLEKTITAAGLDAETEDTLYQPFELKVVFSIRADRMSLLNGLKDYLPNLLQHAYELDALDEQQAARAVTEPAALPQFNPTPGPSPETRGDVERSATTSRTPLPFGGGAGGGVDFDTPPFKYAPETLAAIFAALRDERGRIETSALQIVCKHVEDNIVAKRYTVDGSRHTAGEPSPTNQPVTNQPITVGAADLGDLRSVFRNFYDNTIAALSPTEQDAARRLCEDVLISREGIRLPFASPALTAQGFTPDLLERLARASLLRVERDDQGRMIYEIGHDTLVAPIAEAAFIRREREEKERLRHEADEQRREKDEAITARRRARLLATGATLLALFAFGALTFALIQQRALRQTTVKVAESILQDANELILHLRYDEAWDKIGDAAKLGEKKQEVGEAFLEIAYFYAESGYLEKAKMAFIQAAGMLEKRADLTNFQNLSNLHEALLILDSARFTQLEARYYPTMVKIKGGAFLPNCPTPEDCTDDPTPYYVTLSDYHLAQTETTFWQFALYAEATGRTFADLSPSWGLDGDNPVVKVSWFDACLYANWLSKKQGLDIAYVISNKRKGSSGGDYYEVEERPTANGYHLPTEAEWEYAARGGQNADWKDAYIYAGSDSLDLVGWYYGNSAIDGVYRTHPAARKASNALGLFDMSGNVWEWCWDWYGAYPAGEFNDPRGIESGTNRVRRGGAWNAAAVYARVSYRYRDIPSYGYNTFGFRLARAR